MNINIDRTKLFFFGFLTLVILLIGGGFLLNNIFAKPPISTPPAITPTVMIPTAAIISPSPTMVPPSPPLIPTTRVPITAVPSPFPVATVSTPPSAPMPTPPRVTSTTAQQAWNELNQRSAIVFGVRFDAPPFGEDLNWGNKPCGPKQNNQGFAPQGFDIALAREFVKRWFGNDALEKKIVFKCVTVADRVPALERRDIDFLVAAFTPTNERCISVLCSELHYVEDSIRLLTTRKNQASFVSRGNSALYDLCNKKIAVITRTTTIDVLKGDNEARCFESTPIIVLDTRAEAIRQVKEGIIDAYASDGLIVQALADKEPSTLIVLNGDYGKATSPLSVAVPKAETGWMALIDLTLSAMNDDKWFQYYHDIYFKCQSSIPKIPSVISATLPPYVTNAIAPPATSCKPVPTTTITTTTPTVYYQVQVGDTPSGIAREQLRDFTLWPCLLKYNDISSPLALPVRQIKLPTKEWCKNNP